MKYEKPDYVLSFDRPQNAFSYISMEKDIVCHCHTFFVANRVERLHIKG